jgi:hypothetical protein
MKAAPMMALSILLPISANAIECGELRGDHDSRAREENRLIIREAQKEGRGNLSQSDYPPIIDSVRDYCRHHDPVHLDRAVRDVWREKRDR